MKKSTQNSSSIRYLKNKLPTKSVLPEWTHDYIDVHEVTDTLIDYSFYAARDLGDDIYSFLVENKDVINDILRYDLDKDIVFLWMSSDSGKGALIGTLMTNLMYIQQNAEIENQENEDN